MKTLRKGLFLMALVIVASFALAPVDGLCNKVTDKIDSIDHGINHGISERVTNFRDSLPWKPYIHYISPPQTRHIETAGDVVELIVRIILMIVIGCALALAGGWIRFKLVGNKPKVNTGGNTPNNFMQKSPIFAGRRWVAQHCVKDPSKNVLSLKGSGELLFRITLMLITGFVIILSVSWLLSLIK